jgi:type II secretory pathway pseudopilin PulG
MTRRQFSASKGFSLIEVALSLGIIGFCLIAVLGLLPTGLNIQRTSQEEAKAVSALNMVECAFESLRRQYSQVNGHITWAFPSYFSDNPDPVSMPTYMWVTQSPWSYTFFLDEGGRIIAQNDTTTPKRQLLYVKVYPPQGELSVNGAPVATGQAIQAYAAVAWPCNPFTDKSGQSGTGTDVTQMKNRAGFIDQAIAYAPSYKF